MASELKIILNLLTLGYLINLSWSMTIRGDIGDAIYEKTYPINAKNNQKYNVEEAEHSRIKRDIMDETSNFKRNYRGRPRGHAGMVNIPPNGANDLADQRRFPAFRPNARRYNMNNLAKNKLHYNNDDNDVLKTVKNFQQQTNNKLNPNDKFEEIHYVGDPKLRGRFNGLFRQGRNYTLRDLNRKDHPHLYREFIRQGMPEDFDARAELELYEIGKSRFGNQFTKRYDDDDEARRFMMAKNNDTRVQEETEPEAPVFDDKKYWNKF